MRATGELPPSGGGGESPVCASIPILKGTPRFLPPLTPPAGGRKGKHNSSNYPHYNAVRSSPNALTEGSMYQAWIVSLPLRGVKEIDYKSEAHGSTFEIYGREMMPEIDCNPGLLAASMIKSQSPPELQSTLAAVLPPDIVGVLNETSVHVYAPHALAPAKRSGLSHSSIGAIELPSPHQFTIWPSFVEVRVRGTADPTSVLQELETVCTNLWGISIRTMPGYQRVLSGASDIRGQVRDFGTNQPNEYRKTVPGDIAFPGSQRIDNSVISW